MRDRCDSRFARFAAQGFAPLKRCAITVTASLPLLTLAAGDAWPQAMSPSAAPPPSATPSSISPSSAAVQAPVQSTPQADPAPSPPAPAQENPGLFDEIGKLIDKSRSALPTLKSPQQAIEDLNERAKDVTRDATDNLSRLATPSSMVSGRMACPVSANGAPDCKAAADKLCQSKGYKDGKSLNTDAAEKCSAQVYIPGHKREPGDCRTDNYVTRALCQ
jgi:hypothetical protein